MEPKDPFDNEKLTPNDSLEPEVNASGIDEPEAKPEPTKAEPRPSANDSEPDFDVRPADTYLGPDYDPKKPSGSKTLWLGVLMVAAIIGLTYYAFRSQPSPDQGPETAAMEKTQPATPETTADQPMPGLPEKAPDAADFSPTPETEAAATAPASLPATASSSSPPTVTGDKKAPDASTAKPEDSAKSGSTKTATASQKPKTGASKPAATSSTKPATDGKSAAATATKPAEGKPSATAASKPADSKPAATAVAKPADGKPAAATAEAKPETGSSPAADPKEGAEAKTDEASSATSQEGAAATETTTSASPQTGEGSAAASEISDLWVVNISSTPDASESLRLLNRVKGADVGGQIYFYETTINGKVHHRIRIGFFDSRGAAEAVGQKIKETFQLSATPWAVQPTVEEVERHRKK